MSKLIFFDVNGTLIQRDKNTDNSFENAADILLNTKNSMKTVDTSGRSNQDIFNEILKKHNRSFNNKLWNDFLKIYKNELEKSKNTDIWRKNVDILSFLKKLESTDYKLGLITGELKIGAKFKLKKVGLWKYFPIGGFGNDSITRVGIAKSALKKAENFYKTSFEKIYVIGDTINDIECGKAIGAKTISITTGAHSLKKLKSKNPDLIISNFKAFYTKENLF
ncbi:MAG: HAD family hydrolase [Bacillota bacterium]